MNSPITNAVYGSMSLRNRAVTTSVFWGARQRETLREHQTRLEMSQQLIPTTSQPRIIEYITISDDEEDRSEPEAMTDMIIKEETIQRAPEPVQERISSSPEFPQPSETLESFESPSDDSPDEASMSSIIPDDPKVSEDQKDQEDPEVQQTSSGRNGTPEDPVCERMDQNQNLEFCAPTPDEPIDDSPPILEIQIPKDARESGCLGPSSSTSSTSEKEEKEEKDDKKPRAKRTYKEKGAAPTRKSARGAPPEVAKVQEVGNELIVNYIEPPKPQNRNAVFPTGINRVPFKFEKRQLPGGKEMDPKLQRLTASLAIAMEKPVAHVEGQVVVDPVVEPQPEQPEDAPDEPVSVTDATRKSNKKKFLAPKNRKDQDGKEQPPEIHVGPHYQANEVEMMTEPDEQPDREECMWMPPEEETFLNYSDLRNQYWMAIWRQYEGHVPLEVALQHLMKNKYIMSDSLKTIDQTLLTLPQAFKPICHAQAALYDDKERTTSRARAQNKPANGEPADLGRRRVTRRFLQENAMRNYHVGEVQNFYYRWRKFYKYQARYFSCNCWEPLCEDQAFEPRWACSNCTAHLRPQPESNAKKDLCLICQTHRKFTGALPNMENLVLHDFELQKVRDFERFQNESEDVLTREQVEDMIQKETVERWQRKEMTEEEHDMFNIKKLVVVDRKLKRGYTPEEEIERGRRLAEHLKPFVLPHFSKCNCKLNKHHEKVAKERSRRLKMMRKGEKQQLKNSIRLSIAKYRGDMKMVSFASGAHLPEIKKFLLKNLDTPGYHALLEHPCFEHMKFRISNLPPKRPHEENRQVPELYNKLTYFPEGEPVKKKSRKTK